MRVLLTASSASSCGLTKVSCKLLWLALLQTSIAGWVHAEAEGSPQLIRESYFSKVVGKERDYFVYRPRNFAEQESWPVILFLHGNGERGNGKDELNWVLAHGPLYEAWIRHRDLPFVIIGPQLPMYEMGEVPYIKNRKVEDMPRRRGKVPERGPSFAASGPMTGAPAVPPEKYAADGPPWGWPLHEKELLEMVDAVIAGHRGDPERIYLTGLSYGGFGTWHLLSQHPHKFAAAVPIVGYGHPDQVASIAHAGVPVWCIAGGRDPVVPVQFFYAALNKLEEASRGEVRFTVEEDMSHDAWVRAYGGEDLYDWMLRHRRQSPPESQYH